jgi:hypothetical protein
MVDMAKQRSDNRIGTSFWEDLGKPRRLRRKGRVRRIAPAVNAYLLAVTCFLSGGGEMLELGKGWIALKFSDVRGKLVLGVSPRFVPTRYGPVLDFPTRYGTCCLSWVWDSKHKLSKGEILPQTILSHLKNYPI